MSWAWPSMSLRVATVRRRVARPASTVPSSSSISLARANSASPTRIACAGPCTFHTVSRWRRCSSPSIRSSCSSEKLWTSSTATAPGTPTSGGCPAACADSSASAGRTALPPSPDAGRPAASIQPKWYAATVSMGGASRSTAARSTGVASCRPRSSSAVTLSVSIAGEAGFTVSPLFPVLVLVRALVLVVMPPPGATGPGGSRVR